MKRRVVSLSLLAIFGFVAFGGTAKQYFDVTVAAPILGTGTGLLRKGSTVLCIAETVAGSTPSFFYVRSRDIYSTTGASTADTIVVGNGIAFNEFYTDGVDSAACYLVGAGARIIVSVDNKP